MLDPGQREREFRIDRVKETELRRLENAVTETTFPASSGSGERDSKRRWESTGNSGQSSRGNPESPDLRRAGTDEKVADLGRGGRLEGVQPISSSVEHSVGHSPV
jgi:hypothetical protein